MTPRTTKSLKKQLGKQTKLTQSEIRRAMVEASRAIDTLSTEVASLKRIIVAERAQVIYYTERAIAFLKRETLELGLINFADIADEQKERYVKRAIVELESGDSVVPHGEKKGPSLIV